MKMEGPHAHIMPCGNVRVLNRQNAPPPAAPAAAAAVASAVAAAPVPPPMYVMEEPVAAAFVGASVAWLLGAGRVALHIHTDPALREAQMGSSKETLRIPGGFMYAVQRDSYVDLTFGNDARDSGVQTCSSTADGLAAQIECRGWLSA